MSDKLPSTRGEVVDVIADAMMDGMVRDDSLSGIAHDILAALTAAGLVIAPREATEEMRKDARDYHGPDADIYEIWASMLAVIPWEKQP